VYETKRELAPPQIMVDGVKSYESLYDELTKQIPKESFQVKFTHEEKAKINCDNSAHYRKVIHVLRSCNFNFHTYENTLDQFGLWQRTYITHVNRKIS
jgi:hypothetical protein